MAIDPVELARKSANETFNHSTGQYLFVQPKQSKDRFTKELAANLIKVQEYVSAMPALRVCGESLHDAIATPSLSFAKLRQKIFAPRLLSSNVPNAAEFLPSVALYDFFLFLQKAFLL